MNFMDQFMDHWNALIEKMRPTLRKTGSICKMIGLKLEAAFNYVSKFRKIFLAVPVAVAAVVLALNNLAKLPVLVGINLQANGEFGVQLMREVAVLGPMAVTALCLILMFCSKRVLTPWLVSVFSLAVPVAILLTNTFPA